MEYLALRRQFARAVAPLEVDQVQPNTGRRAGGRPGRFALDVARDGRDEAFVLHLSEGAAERWEFVVANADSARRHLLLVARPAEGEVGAEVPRHFLCGRDERHLFVAGLAARVPTVAAALAALKPEAVLESEVVHRVGARARNRRRNPGFVRQGEWFFLPRPGFVPAVPALIQRDEPISRGNGRAHVVEYLYREGSGEQVWVCSRYPRGVSGHKYRELVRSQPGATRWGWRAMYRTTDVYARGRVRHPDHATIVLPFWHRIVPNLEAGAGTAIQRSVAFLD